jgi:lipoprotein-anchoring transpeptidase ErfK/SrfK
MVTLAWPAKNTIDLAPAGTTLPTTVATNALSATATASVVVNSAPSFASAPLDLKVADSTMPASNVMQQSVTTSASPLRVAIAAADASAVARPTSIASVPTGPAPAAPELTADGRIVTSKHTTITYEPLHAVPIPAAGLRVAPPSIADSIVVYKRERTLTLFYRGVPQRSYFVALGSKPVGDKLQAGDKRTPEGLFHIDAHNPASKYHLALHISYPDAEHRARSQSLGFDPGGEIMIHGLPKEYSDVGKDHRLDDWTNGCVALTNQEIEEIWRAVPDGTPVQIKP